MSETIMLNVGSRLSFTVQEGSRNLFTYQPQENHLVVIADIVSQLDNVCVVAPDFFERVIRSYSDRNDSSRSMNGVTLLAPKTVTEGTNFTDYSVVFVIGDKASGEDSFEYSIEECIDSSVSAPVISVLEEAVLEKKSGDSYNYYDVVYQLDSASGDMKDSTRKAKLKHLKDIYVPLEQTHILEYNVTVNMDTSDTVNS